MPYRWSQRSRDRLATCDPDLILLFNEALADPACPSDMSIVCGHRGEAEQNAAYARGASSLKWPRSRHNSVPSMAVDVAPYVAGSISWDWDYYRPLAAHIKRVWSRLKSEGRVSGSLVWGGDWTRLKDGPHWQIDR